MLQFTPGFLQQLQRLEDSVFSPDKRSMDAEKSVRGERASFAHGCVNRSEKGVNALASRRSMDQA